ncbi:hypothetical protein BB561_001971 [Smittium simulii]|uniref:FAD-binding PCMH-type domain-containing protein n=1 Tax=Smittium simulii TaxID=133385 RepID=A0A2T9YS70_9FUNG|nr:hypothetical protein BB561_001971 [Smittium simulii]
MEKFNSPTLATMRGKAEVVLFPTSTEQTSAIVKYSGSMAVYDEIVINLSKMNKIHSIDQDSGAMVCDAGCILQDLDLHLSDYDLTMPLDLGAKGSCHIGGNISTNAGGIRYIKYGSLHGSVLGLKVVLPNGQILDNLSTLRKDSTGYDVKQLFIGAEGTLGIVTGVSILTHKKAKYCDLLSMDITLNGLEKTNPLAKMHNYYVFIETQGSHKEHDLEKIMGMFEELQEDGTIEDGIMAEDITQMAKIWELRESIITAHSKYGETYAMDLSLPTSKVETIVNDLKDFLEGLGVYDRTLSYKSSPKYVKEVTGFGHIGDGNLHLNVIVEKYQDSFTTTLEKFIFEYIQNLKGSISAEHGIGLLKPDFLHYSKSKEAIELMTIIKNSIDPKGIMNPYKVLPSS